MDTTTTAQPLHMCSVKKKEMIVNRLHILVHGAALIALFHYRLTTLYHMIITRDQTQPLVPYLLLVSSEALLTFLWLLHRPYKWRPVARTAYPERLPEDEKLPPVDIFICTADPGREPSLNVMSTVISAMALDYPPDKLAVYLQDDGGAPVTRQAVREAYKFARYWVPFCRKYGVQSSRCPEKFFSTATDEIGGSEFVAERNKIEEKYEEFKESLVKNSKVIGTSVSNDHPAIVEVINNEDDEKDESDQKGPLLVYVAREKRPSHPHNFKAGAINTLIRVSAVMSNAPYILLLDCDHYCNDPSSVRQAMCFHLDPEISSKLSFVQFPQRFHNIGEHDIYDGRLNYFKRRWHGADGLGGPVITGCNMYMKRDALYGNKNIKNGLDFKELRTSFGSSNTLINSIYRNHETRDFSRERVISDALKKEVQLVASSTYDTQSLWGKQVGFIYFSVVEDIMTSEKLHREGWTSVWVDPPKPCFLGSSPTDLSTAFFQQSRWGLGLMQIALSKHCSLFYGRGKMSILHCISYAALTFDALYVVPFWGLAVVPPICLLNSIPLYPKVSDPYFAVFAFIFMSSQLKHVHEVMIFGDTFRTVLYEQRVWMMKSASCYLYATLDAILDKFGFQEAVFNLTDKVVDDERVKRFNKGIYDFQGSKWFIVPICSLYILNVVAFVVGASRIVRSDRRADHELLAQAFISFFGIIVNYHVFQGMVLRKDKGRVSTSLSLVSIVIATFIMGFGSLLLVR